MLMNINVCDRCGQVYAYNQNNKFVENGITGCEVVSRMPQRNCAPKIEYNLCDTCCELLFEFLETGCEYAASGRPMNKIWGFDNLE